MTIYTSFSLYILTVRDIDKYYSYQAYISIKTPKLYVCVYIIL